MFRCYGLRMIGWALNLNPTQDDGGSFTGEVCESHE